MQITKETIIGDLVEAYPHTVEILENHGLHCVGCHANPFETLESGVYEHGYAEQELQALIKELETSLKSIPATKTITAGQKLITITPSAAKQIQYVLKEQNKTDHFLKLKAVPGGCAGYNYEIMFVKDVESTDLKVEEQGLTVYMDATSAPLLQGSEIDYVLGLMNAGFKIRNPNQKHGCACGNSFR